MTSYDRLRRLTLKHFAWGKTLNASLLVAACSCLPAHAGIVNISDSQAFSLNNARTVEHINSTSSQTTRWTSVYLDGFDSSLGSLIGVNAWFNTNYSLYNSFSVRDPSTGFFSEDNVRGNGGGHHNLRVDLVDPSGGANSSYASISHGCSDDDGYCSRNSSRSGGFSQNLAIYAPLSAFVDRGLNSVRFDMSNYLRSFIGGCYDTEDICRSTSSNYWSGVMNIKYTYEERVDPPTSLPEPGSLLLLGLGLLGLAVARKKV